MTVPLYVFVRGDSLGLILLVDDMHSIAEVGLRAQRAASMRVAPAQSCSVFRGGRLLSAELTVSAAGLATLDRIDVVPELAR
jgi:hypothetical protein